MQSSRLGSQAAALAAILWIAGCRSAPDSRAVVIDTLPSGVVRVVNSEPGPRAEWTLSAPTRFGDGDGSPGELIMPSIVRTDAWGRVYIVDRQPTTLKVFDSQGNFLRTIGRAGGGPGEYQVVYPAIAGDRLIVHDPQQQRTSIFDTSGTYLSSWPSACCNWNHIAVDSAERIYVPINTTPATPEVPADVAFTRFRFDGTLVDTVRFPGRPLARWEFRWSRGGRSGMTAGVVPFAAQQYHAVHPAGGFVIGWSSDGRLARTRTDSDTMWVSEWPVATRPLPDSLRQAETNQFLTAITELVGEAQARSVVSINDVPTVAPLFTTITVDPLGYIWTRRPPLPGDSTTVFDTFDSDGIWLGSVTVPAVIMSEAPVHVSRDAIFALVEDEDGRRTILRYSITR